MDFKDKITLITGATAGIGEACARHFAAAGSNLILAARRYERLKDLAAELHEKHSINCHILHLDVRDREMVQKTLPEIPHKFKAIDILLNNAGLASGLAPIQSGDYEDWDKMLDTNVKGLLNMTRELLPGMLERGRGHIINIGSIAGYQVYPNGGVYCASKHAVRALTQGMMMDLLGTPVRVSSVDPGLVETEFSIVRFHSDTQRASQVYNDIQPLTGDDIAEAVMFCASRPPHVNIQEMVVLPKDQSSAYHLNR